jgi:hypothetical protein
MGIVMGGPVGGWQRDVLRQPAGGLSGNDLGRVAVSWPRSRYRCVGQSAGTPVARAGFLEKPNHLLEKENARRPSRRPRPAHKEL